VSDEDHGRWVAEPDIDKKATKFINKEHHFWTYQLPKIDKKAANFIDKGPVWLRVEVRK